jgi:hypothetical protein
MLRQAKESEIPFQDNRKDSQSSSNSKENSYERNQKYVDKNYKLGKHNEIERLQADDSEDSEQSLNLNPFNKNTDKTPLKEQNKK